MSQVSLDLGGVVTVSNGSGLFVLLGDNPLTTDRDESGVAGSLSADVALNIPGVTFEGTFGVSVNTADRAVATSTTLAGQTLSFDLQAGPYLRVEGLGVNLGIGGLVLSGDFAFEQVTLSPGVTEVRILLNNVNLDLGGDVLRVSNGSGALVILPDLPGTAGINEAGLAGQLAVSVELNVPGVSLGGTVRLAINQTPVAVSRTFSLGGQDINFALPAGSFLRVEVLNGFLEVVDQRLEADFIAFEQVTRNGPDGMPATADDVQIVRVVASGVGLRIGAGDTDILVISNGVALIEITPAGLAGSVAADIAINIPGLASASASVTVQINNRLTAATIAGETVTLADGVMTAAVPGVSLPAGPFLRAQVLDLKLDILGVVLVGDFVFERSTTASGESVIRVALSDVGLNILGDASLNIPGIVNVSNGQGALLLDSQGLAADFSADVAVDPTQFGLSALDFTLAGTFRIAINNRLSAVDEVIMVGDTAVVLDLPAGPFLRVEAINAELTILGQTLTGNFAFEKFQLPGTPVRDVIKVSASNVGLRLGDGSTDFVVLSEGVGLFLLLPEGIAADVQADVALNIPGITFGGTFGLQINTAVNGVGVALAINEAFSQTITVELDPAATASNGSLGSNLVVDTQAALDAALILGGFRAGDVVASVGDGGRIVLSVVNPDLSLGDDAALTVKVGAQLAIADTTDNASDASKLAVDVQASLDAALISAGFSAGDVVASVGTGGRIEINAADATLILLNGTEFADDLATRRDATETAVLTAGGALLELKIGLRFEDALAARRDTTDTAVLTGTGTLSLELTVNRVLTIGDEISFDIGASSTAGNGSNADALRADVQAAVNAALVTAGFLAGDVAVTVGTGGRIEFAAANPAITIADPSALEDAIAASRDLTNTAELTGDPLTLTLVVGTGTGIRVFGNDVQLGVFGQSLGGNFVFEQTTTAAGDSVIRIAASNVTISLGDGTTDFVRVTNGEGVFIVTSFTDASGAKVSGMAGRLAATVEVVNIPGVSFVGTFEVSINTLAVAVNETVGGVLLDVPAGPFLRIEGTNIALTVAGQTLSGNFSFEQITKPNGTKVIKVAVTNLSLELTADGARVFKLEGVSGVLLITPQGIAGQLQVTNPLGVGLELTGQ